MNLKPCRNRILSLDDATPVFRNVPCGAKVNHNKFGLRCLHERIEVSHIFHLSNRHVAFVFFLSYRLLQVFLLFCFCDRR